MANLVRLIINYVIRKRKLWGLPGRDFDRSDAQMMHDGELTC